MRSYLGLFLGLVLVAATAAVLWNYWPLSSTGRADANDEQQVAFGAAVYRQSCASCHGANLAGQPDWRSRNPDGRLPAPPHDETGHTWHHSEDVLFEITRNGVTGFVSSGYESDMPAFSEVLTDDEIWAVLAFIKSRWPEQIRARHSVRSSGGN